MDINKSMLGRQGFQLVVAFLVGTLWFVMLGHRDLVEPDEGRYAEIPREMVVSGDWVTPRLNGFKYFEKPPFQYWMTAINYELFGQSNTTARLWTAFFGFVCGLFMWQVGNALFGRPSGFYAFIVTISSFLFVGAGHVLTLDMSVSVFMAMAVGALAVAKIKKANPVSTICWMLFSWSCLAGAVLSKGLIGVVLPAATVVFYSLWQRDWKIWLDIHLIKGLLLFFAITVPWFVLVSQQNSEFLNFFFIHEHWERYTSTVHRRDGPFYYFIPIFLIGVCPWLATAIRAIFKPGFALKPNCNGEFDSKRFLWIFCVVTFVFFSLGKSKLPAYILPMIPVVALLVGDRLKINPNLKLDAYITGILAIVILLISGLVTRFASDYNSVDALENCRPFLIGAGMLLLAAAAHLFYADRNVKLHISAAGLCALFSFQLLGWGFQPISESRSSKAVADAISENKLDKVNVYAVETYPQTLPVYLDKIIILSVYKGELGMGIGAEPDEWLDSRQSFIDQWQSEDIAVAVFKHKTFEQYEKLGLLMHVIYDGPRYVAVAKKLP